MSLGAEFPVGLCAATLGDVMLSRPTLSLCEMHGTTRSRVSSLATTHKKVRVPTTGRRSGG